MKFVIPKNSSKSELKLNRDYYQMNKFLQFNELIEIGKIFKDCESYLIALEYFDKAIELSSILPINQNRILEAYDLRGNTKIFLNKYHEAIIDYTRAIELDPNISYLYFFRGLSYESLKQYKEALMNFQLSLKLDPDFELANIMIDYLEGL